MNQALADGLNAGTAPAAAATTLRKRQAEAPGAVYFNEARSTDDLVELVKLVQDESGCSAEEARNQIRNALADGAIWHLHWEPEPPPNDYCQSIFGSEALAHGKPVYPPPPSPEIRHDFKDTRDVSHWQDVKIDWEQGLILDDFEDQLYRKLGGNLYSVMGCRPDGYPKPRSPQWRTLWLGREACKKIWAPMETTKFKCLMDEAAASGSASIKRLDYIKTDWTMEPISEKPEKELRSTINISPPLEHAAELPAQEAEQTSTASPYGSSHGGAIP